MKTHELEMNSLHSPEEVVQFLEDHDLQEGDTLRLLTNEEHQAMAFIALVVIVVLAVVYFFRKAKEDRISDGEEILDSLFKGKTTDEIEELVQEEYGIRIEYKVTANEDDEWRNLSAQTLMKAYSIDEPDYTEADVKEPNPEYKVWKDK